MVVSLATITASPRNLRGKADKLPMGYVPQHLDKPIGQVCKFSRAQRIAIFGENILPLLSTPISPLNLNH